MTQIQSQSIPLALEGKDVIAQAKTGSGKTVAFALPLIHKLDVKFFRIQSIVLAPTRELANQIALEIRKLCRYIHNVKVLTLCGGLAFRPQVTSLFHGAHIVVGTPGRVLKHLKEDNIDTSHINTVVLDEADKMLDMGFYDDIMSIVESVPKHRQTLLFSATYEEDIQRLSSTLLHSATKVKVQHQKIFDAKQIFIPTPTQAKTDLIPKLIRSYQASSVLIFCNTKLQSDRLSDALYAMNIDTKTLHSDMEQKDRDETIVVFSNKSYPVLIATDVASRGLHIDDIELVINYDLARDEKVHTHRIGRTARAGKGGVAISLYDIEQSEQVKKLQDIFENTQIVSPQESVVHEDKTFEIESPYRTIFINAGKKQKLRKGDILGALTAGIGLDKDDIGVIDSKDFCSYVAVKKSCIQKALHGLSHNKIKGKYFRVFQK